MGSRRSDEEILADIGRRQEQMGQQAKDVRARIAGKRRARDTRRKIQIGSFVLQRLEAEPERFADWRTLIRDELPGFLKSADRDLFPDILGESREEGGDRGLTVGDIMSRLNAERRRCTYGAAAGVLGIAPAEVGPLLGERRPESSWVVSAKTGRPVGYSPEQVHPDLERRPDVIGDPEELRALCKSGG